MSSLITCSLHKHMYEPRRTNEGESMGVGGGVGKDS